LTDKDPNYLDLRSPCGAAIGQLLYNYDGRIYTCDEARTLGDDIFMLGNVNEDTYKEILTSEQTCAVVTASTNDAHVCNSCAYKPYCGLCPVCSYAKDGSLIEKVSQSDRCKIFKAQFDYIFDKLINDNKSAEAFREWVKEKGV
jgi:radical SAM protein with 4Fe4S-binding SPASM domain